MPTLHAAPACRASRSLRRRPATRRPGWPNVRQGFVRSCMRSSKATSSEMPPAASTALSTSRSALSATRPVRGDREASERSVPDFELEVFEERHHFDPPHRIEPERLANSLQTLWRRAEPTQPSKHVRHPASVGAEFRTTPLAGLMIS